MAKKARQRISYVLELPNSTPGGHRLGVNGLAVDREHSILYSGGRDGVVCAWDLNLDLNQDGRHAAVVDTSSASQPSPSAGGDENGNAAPRAKNTTRFRVQTQAHTHWINDITLATKHTALVSASSDLLVKVWRPLSAAPGLEAGQMQPGKEEAGTGAEPATIGQHADYVKCVATPDQDTGWVASGGLDRKICLWDLAGHGKTLEIDVSGEEVREKGSVYALSVNHNILASGGPESIVRLWDPKTGKRITKFVGHTDNVRAVLVNGAGDTVMTASSDQTVKVWSVTAGRCMYTLTMHNDSVWSLFSDDPDLGVFYSSDRSGLVVKTDVRGTLGEMDDGLSVAIAQENEGVSKVVACGDNVWTATSRSSINRWASVDTGADIQFPDASRKRSSFMSAKSREGSLVSTVPVPVPVPASTATPATTAATAVNGPSAKDIPLKAILRISNTAAFPPALTRADPEDTATVVSRKGPDILAEPVNSGVEPVHNLPEETLEGQFGLVKHRLLNDRRRVLTLDTAGDVLLWDLIKCRPIKSFGKRHLEDVEPEVNTLEAVAPWCSIDTSSGNLTVALDPFNCFDAEMYADELTLEEPVVFREDQRINLGKWVLRYLFANLVDEEIRRDESHRMKLNEAVEARLAAARANPLTLSVSAPPSTGAEALGSGVTTPRANGFQHLPTTPGLAIGLASPTTPLPDLPEGAVSTAIDKRPSPVGRPSAEKEDYFSNAIHFADGNQAGAGKPAQTPITAEPPADEKAAKSPAENSKDKDKEKEKDKEKDKDGAKSPSTPFGKKFRIGMSFKKTNRSASTTAAEKPVVADEKAAGAAAEGSESSSTHEKEFDDGFLGVIQRIRSEYDKQLVEHADQLVETGIKPSEALDTPVLKLPPGTKVILQEETSGGSAEMYRGTVETVGADADAIEQRAPLWLGEVLLANAIPPKDPVKVSFVLHPWQDSLPIVAAPDGNNRLNANRMLRVKKILAYVAERIDPQAAADQNNNTNPDPNALKPEDYLELYCNDQLLPITMSLATLRAHVWKGGNDVVLYYKANGRKEIPMLPPPRASVSDTGLGAEAAASAAGATTATTTSPIGTDAAAANLAFMEAAQVATVTVTTMASIFD